MKTASEMKAWAAETARSLSGMPPYVLVLRGLLKGVCLLEDTMTAEVKEELRKAALQALQETMP